jgi:hypothetical protein
MVEFQVDQEWDKTEILFWQTTNIYFDKQTYGFAEFCEEVGTLYTSDEDYKLLLF